MPPPILEVNDISKSFGTVMALKGVSFDLLPNEIHGLVGENGAGKSTLMRILAGVYQPDSGEIRLGGERVALESPVAAHRLGIGMVYQDTRLVDDLDVAQNIALGQERTRFGLVQRGRMEQRARDLLARLGVTLHPRLPVRDLAYADRQSVEIARALNLEPHILILDEPTTGLDPIEVERLFTVLRGLRAEGHSIIFISHRLPEVLDIADRVTVMKDGEVVATVPVDDTLEEDTLVRLMVGRELSMAFPPRDTASPEPLLEVNGLTSGRDFQDVTFTLRCGEIVGLGGIQGNGQTRVARALAGLLPTRGTVSIRGKSVSTASPSQSIASGIVYLSSDRRREALFLPHSIKHNVILPHLSQLSRAGVMDGRRETAAAQTVIDRLRVQPPDMEYRAQYLSGGNQQKVAVGRWLDAKPLVYIFDEPTQGVDVGTKLELYRIMRQLAADGAAILILSTDVIELLGMCDRILVMSHGRIVDEVAAADATEERIVGSAVKAGEGNGRAAPREATGAERKTASPPSLAQRWISAALVLALVVVIGLYTQQQSEFFLRPRNLSNIAIQVAPLALVAIGMMATILLGGIDLSVGPTMSLTTAIASYLITEESPLGVAGGVLVCLLAGTLIGLANGVMIRFFRIPDLIATISSFSMVFGLALVVRPSPGGLIDGNFATAVTNRIELVPVVAVITLILYIIGEVVLLRTRIGTSLYAIGSNREAALVSGIPVDNIRLGAYVFSGFMAAVGGLVLAARIGSGDPQAGDSFTLAAITAVVVGGTSIFGGRGSLVGTLAGCILVIEIQSALNQLQVSSYYQYIWIGVLTLLAVGIYSFRESSLRARLRTWMGQRSQTAATAGEGVAR
jgi:ribose transport system ATP-binding protein